MAKHGKRYREAYEKVDRDRELPARRGGRADQGDRRAPSSTRRSRSTSALGVNVRHAEEQLRGTIALPHGLGKDVTDRRLRPGRQGPRGRGGRRRLRRRRGPRRARRGAAGPTSTSRSRPRT